MKSCKQVYLQYLLLIFSMQLCFFFLLNSRQRKCDALLLNIYSKLQSNSQNLHCIKFKCQCTLMQELFCYTLAAGKWWGSRDQQPILALHGWQDNAATFDPLLTMLPSSLSVLAIDVPGHGFSSHYPPGIMYHFTEDIVLIRKIVRQFGWKKLIMLGHSMGSIYSFVYAALFPMDVEKIIGFDILRPVALNSKDFVKNGGEKIDKFINLILSDRKNIEYTVNALVERQYEATRGSISKESCKMLQSRGTFPSENRVGYVTLTRDIRLKIPLLHSLPNEFLLEIASRIKCEVLNIKFKNGPYYEKREFYEQTLKVVESSAKRLEYHEVEGTHHAHLNNPENVAQIVENFLK